MDSAQKAKYLIENADIMVVATADSAGKPWISPVGFAYDSAYNLYWVSYKEALHSHNIASRPEIAISIFGQLPEGGMDGVYIDATATELKTTTEIEAAMRIFATKQPQQPKFMVTEMASVTGEAAWRMYKAVPLEFSKRSNKTVNGQAVTVREPVQML